MLDHVKGEIVSPAEGPDGHTQQKGQTQIAMFPQDQSNGKQTQQQKQKSLQIQQPNVLDVTHDTPNIQLTDHRCAWTQRSKKPAPHLKRPLLLHPSYFILQNSPASGRPSMT